MFRKNRNKFLEISGLTTLTVSNPVMAFNDKTTMSQIQLTRGHQTRHIILMCESIIFAALSQNGHKILIRDF